MYGRELLLFSAFKTTTTTTKEVNMTFKIKKTFKANIPIWALSYLCNLDYFTISEEEVNTVENWLEEQRDHKEEIVDVDIISFENEFQTEPAFGEPCVCGECIITIKEFEEMRVY